MGESLTFGAHPLAAFPNEHFLQAIGSPRWVPPEQIRPVDELSKAVSTADWPALFEAGKTKLRADASWSANLKRCEKLQELCRKDGVKRVLEIGAFCGVGSMTMADVLPEDGEVVALDHDPFLLDFRKDIKAKDPCWKKVTCMAGEALDSLNKLKEQAAGDAWRPFDLAIIDADKKCLREYFTILEDTPHMLSAKALVCVDITPFKGQQLFMSYVKSGKPDEWVVSSGQSQIDDFYNYVKALGTYTVHACGRNLLSIEKGAPKLQQTLSPRSIASGADPLSTFPNEHMRSQIRWAAPQPDDHVEHLRQAAREVDWAELFHYGHTKVRMEASWCATPERCVRLVELCKLAKAKRVLEVGSYCGVATMAMAEALPTDGQVVAVDLDSFVLNFGQNIKAKCPDWKKVRLEAGPAAEVIAKLIEESATAEPFDLVVIDADKTGMLDYFNALRGAPRMLSANACVCVDMTPYKGQLFSKFVKSGKMDDWVVKSGQDSIDHFHDFIHTLDGFDVKIEDHSLAVMWKRG